MGDGDGIDTGSLPFVIQTRQKMETLIDEVEPILAGGTLTSAVLLASGYNALNLFLRADQLTEIRVFEAARATGPFVQTSEFTSKLDPAGAVQMIAEQATITGKFVRLEVENLSIVDQGFLDLCVQAVPVAGGGAGGAGGTGSPNGPGNTIATKADVVVPAAVETPVLVAADIPSGSRRVTIKNVSETDTVRIKDAGAGGGATRGLQLQPLQSMSIGTQGGALAPCDAFSTGGVTLCFLFERD